MSKKSLILGLFATFCLVVNSGCTQAPTTSDQGAANTSATEFSANRPAATEEAMEVYIANFSVSVFSSSSQDTRPVNYIATPQLGVTTNNSIEALRLRDVRFSAAPKVGNARIIETRHLRRDASCRDYYFNAYDCSDTSYVGQSAPTSSGTIDYAVTEDAEFYDEVTASGGILTFGAVVENIGSFSVEDVMKATGSYDSGQMMNYVVNDGSLLDAVVSFDLEVDFTDGTRLTKSFQMPIDGGQILTETFPGGELVALDR